MPNPNVICRGLGLRAYITGYDVTLEQGVDETGAAVPGSFVLYFAANCQNIQNSCQAKRHMFKVLEQFLRETGQDDFADNLYSCCCCPDGSDYHRFYSNGLRLEVMLEGADASQAPGTPVFAPMPLLCDDVLFNIPAAPAAPAVP